MLYPIRDAIFIIGHKAMNDIIPVPAPTQPAEPPAKPKRSVGRPFPKGVSGNPGGQPSRARAALNAATLRGFQLAYDKYGDKACMMVAKQKPDIFLKLLVLLVPREMEVTHKGGVKAMSDEQLEQGIEAIRAMLAARADGSQAQVIEGVVEPTDKRDLPNVKARKTRRVAEVEAQTGGVVEDVVDSPTISKEQGG